MITIIQTSAPEDSLRQLIAQHIAKQGAAAEWAFVLSYQFRQDFLPDAPLISLLLLVGGKTTEADTQIGFSILEESEARSREIEQLPESTIALQRFCQQQESPWFGFDKPMYLQAVHIPKPWGQEIWYTGIEARGQSGIGDGGYFIPLSWLLAFCGTALCGQPLTSLVLLKILDPLPTPVFGDLYFEMHREKREVYIVTHVDESAWPSGQGGIRFGFDQQRRNAAESDDDFKQQYLNAVQAYRAVREEIDGLLDDARRAEGVGMVEAVDAQTMQRWLQQIPEFMLEKEQNLRAIMEAFIHTRPLQVGDVVKVPTLTPHSLLHGVRTVEFQTPVYERQILSFAQKVLTQSHWDTEAAMNEVSLDAPGQPTLPVIHQNNHVLIESVAIFEDFEVERLTLQPSAHCALAVNRYLLLMTVSGNADVNGFALPPEQAVFCGLTMGAIDLANNTADAMVCLLARPR